MAFRERHLTQRCEYAEALAIGTDLQIKIESERDDVAIRLPFESWVTGEPRERKITRNGIYVERWASHLVQSRDRSVSGEVIIL